MNTTVDFVVKITNLTAAAPKADEQSMEITANVEEVVSVPTYTVTIQVQQF